MLFDVFWAYPGGLRWGFKYMIKRKKTDYVQFKIRLRESLRKQLEDAARVKDVSLNSEMVSRLEESFTRASMQDERNKMRATVRDEVEKLTEKLTETWVEIASRTAVQSMRKIESESPPPVPEATPSFNERQRLEALTAGKEELEARLKASLSRSEKLEAQLKAALEARLPRPI
jgi:hypothetical protein